MGGKENKGIYASFWPNEVIKDDIYNFQKHYECV